MTAQEKFQALVREACAKHGQNTWGQKHSMHVIVGMFAEETGASVADLENSEAAKLASKVVNPSAFAQWMAKHVEGFERQTKKQATASALAEFKL